MRKSFLLTVCFVLFSVPAVWAQLIIGNGTRWISDNTTQVVLDDLGFQYDGAPGLLSNRFIFRGVNNSSISGATLPEFNVIEVDKQGTAKLVLQRSISISQSAEFTNGLFDLNNNNVTLAPTALINGENETRHFTGNNGGYIRINVNMNAPVSFNPGNLGAVITSPANLGAVTISRGHQSQTNSFGNGSSVLRYYDIDPANNSSLNATLRFNYLDAELNGLPENSLVMWKSSNLTTWNNLGFTSRDVTANYVEKTGITDFSKWTLSSVANALPVTGLKLSGTWNNNGSVLTWTTIAEYDNDHFEIERKYPAEAGFSKISFANSKNPDGNSQTLTAYNYTDLLANRNEQLILYRLKQVDKNGQYQYSNTIAIRPGGKKEFIVTVYPTVAVNNSIFIQTGNMNIQKMQMQLFDMKGSLIVNQQLSYQSQLLQLPMVTQGMYRLVIRSDEWMYSRMFTKK